MSRLCQCTPIATATKMGANLDTYHLEFKPVILHPITSENVYMIIDPSRGIKLVRTAWEYMGKLVSNDVIIDFKYITKLLKITSIINCNLETKLLKHHEEFHNDPMKVRLSVQLLFKSVADALELLMTLLPDLKKTFENASANYQVHLTRRLTC